MHAMRRSGAKWWGAHRFTRRYVQPQLNAARILTILCAPPTTPRATSSPRCPMRCGLCSTVRCCRCGGYGGCGGYTGMFPVVPAVELTVHDRRMAAGGTWGLTNGGGSCAAWQLDGISGAVAAVQALGGAAEPVAVGNLAVATLLRGSSGSVAARLPLVPLGLVSLLHSLMFGTMIAPPSLPLAQARCKGGHGRRLVYSMPRSTSHAASAEQHSISHPFLPSTLCCVELPPTSTPTSVHTPANHFFSSFRQSTHGHGAEAR